MFSNKTKTARKGGWLTLFGVICYNHCGHCYIRRSDPLFLSRSPRQEGGGASAEESISAFCMCGHCTVHFLYKSAMTARVGTETVINSISWLWGSDCCSSVPLYLYNSIRSGFVKATGLELFIRYISCFQPFPASKNRAAPAASSAERSLYNTPIVFSLCPPVSADAGGFA